MVVLSVTNSALTVVVAVIAVIGAPDAAARVWRDEEAGGAGL